VAAVPGVYTPLSLWSLVEWMGGAADAATAARINDLLATTDAETASRLLSAGGTALTLVGIALSAAVYAVLGVVLARAGSRQTKAFLIGMVVGAGAGLIGGAIRAYLIRDYLGGVLAGFALADLLIVTLAVFVALSVLVSVAAGASLTWLSFRAGRRPPRPRPPS